MSEEIKLTDEQVNVLSNDETVKAIRTRFLKDLTAFLKSDRNPDEQAAVTALQVEYETAHANLVQHVIENPPTPMSIPVVSRRGFK